MPTRRAAHQATLLPSGDVLITGGCTTEGCGAIQRTADLFDPLTDTFRAASPMAVPRASHVGAGLRDGRVLIAGGWTGSAALASAEIYDPTTGRFSALAAMGDARISPAATLLRDGRVLVTGGEDQVGSALASAEIFDPVSERFSAVGPMLSRRMSHVAIPLADGRVLVAGGRAGRGEVLRSAEIFDPATGRFEPAGEMRVARHKHAAVRLDNGSAFIVGGSDVRDFRGRHASTEVYDPATGRFTAGPEMQAMRHKIRDAVVVLRSGLVVVAGGATRPELYDHRARRFVSSVGELGGLPMFATATLLRTGDVVLLGGYDERIRPSASVWRLLAP
jgi:hypothetical protein